MAGATATGKSRLGLELAQRLGTAILSADSRQVYRELDIGTAKPTLAERERVPHYLIDICDPTETLTVAQYQERVYRIIDSVPPRPWLLVGGTGLYIKAVVRGLKIPRVPPQPQLRSQFESVGQGELYAYLKQVDRLAAEKIHPNDRVRTMRALEVFYATGKPISQQQGEAPPDYDILQLGLDCEPEVLRSRIAVRTEKMIAAGWVEEVERLTQKYGWDLPLLNTLGYQQMKQYLAGELSLEQAKEATVLHTAQFAKRQRTWFAAYPEIEWFDTTRSDLVEAVWERVQEFLN